MIRQTPCPVCNCPESSVTEVLENYTILTCYACGLLFADPMHAGNCSFYNKHIAYAQSAPSDVVNHVRSANKQANRRLITMLPKGSKILDIGCGYGAFVHFCVQQGYNAYGIDFSREHITAGREMLGLGERLILGDIKELRQIVGQDKKFKLVTLFEIIEHVENPRGLIQDACEVLDMGGLLVLSCPNEARWQPTRRIFVDHPPHHLTRWRPDTLRRFLENEGFEHVKTEVESSFSDFLWVLYVNYSARRRLANIGSSEDIGADTRSANVRKLKMFSFGLLKLLCLPFNLGLKVAGIGTMGMRMIVRKV